jgi:L-malate glycosyltransferase
VDSMAAHAIGLLSNEEMLQKFRENALKQAKVFDIHNILPQYEAYYQEVMERAVWQKAV